MAQARTCGITLNPELMSLLRKLDHSVYITLVDAVGNKRTFEIREPSKGPRVDGRLVARDVRTNPKSANYFVDGRRCVERGCRLWATAHSGASMHTIGTVIDSILISRKGLTLEELERQEDGWAAD